MKTYWLYYRDQPIYAVRMAEGTADQDVRTYAIGQHQRVPLCYPEAPYAFRDKLSRTTIRTFETDG